MAETETQRKPGPTPDEALTAAVYSLYLKKGSLTFAELAVLVNETLGTSFTSEAIRKRIRRHETRAGIQGDNGARDLFRELDEKKQVFRDERTGWHKQNREQARTDVNFDRLIESLETIRGNLFPIDKEKEKEKTTDAAAQKTLIILLSDWHVGLECHSIYGTYSTEIARERLAVLMDRVREIQSREHCARAVVVTAGDLIHGAIRRSVQIQARENIIEQIQGAVELLSNFIYELCSVFPQVTLTGCSGNHSRLQESKDATLHDERLDDLINWIVAQLLKTQPGFSYIPPVDSSIARVTIGDREIVAVHGDYDDVDRGGIQQLVTSLHTFPDLVLTGHKHSPAMVESQGVTVIRGGSLCGSGDDYTVKKRLYGRACQVLILWNDAAGVEAVYPVILE